MRSELDDNNTTFFGTLVSAEAAWGMGGKSNHEAQGFGGGKSSTPTEQSILFGILSWGGLGKAVSCTDEVLRSAVHQMRPEKEH